MTQIQLRRNTAAAAAASNPVLAVGEPGMETDTGRTKLGDGVTAWVDLPYDAPDEAALNATYVSAGDKGAAFITKLDQKAGSAVLAVLSDSTWFKNGSSLYVGTDGYEAPRKIGNWLAARYPTAEIGYHAQTTWGTYAAEVVVGAGVTTVLSDTFAGTAANLYGSTPDIGGGTWNDNSAGVTVRYSLSGDGTATQASSGLAFCPVTAPGRLKTTWVLDLITTASGNINLVGAYISSSNFLWMTINSTDTIEFKTTIGGVTTVVATKTFVEAGLPATGTVEITPVIEHKPDGTIVYTLGTATYTHTLSGGEDTTFSVSGNAGMYGTQAGHKIKSIVSTTPAATQCDIWNGAFSSKNVVDSTNLYATLVPVTPDVVVICHSHNQTTDTAAAFETKLDTLVTTIRAAHPNAAIVIASQNPETTATADYAAHAVRQADLRRYARAKGFGYLPVFEAFQSQANPSALVIGDGVHPTPAGVDLIGVAAQTYLTGLSLKPA